MFHMNKGVWAMGIPAVLSLGAVLEQSAILFVLPVMAHFIILRVVPAFRGCENVWMFVFVAISSIPLNVHILSLMNEWGYLFGSLVILGVSRCILYYAILFSIEEIIMGIMTRLIWKRQKKFML